MKTHHYDTTCFDDRRERRGVFANLRALLITLITLHSEMTKKSKPIDGSPRPVSPRSCDMRFFITLSSLRGYILYILYIRSLRGRRGRGPHKADRMFDVIPGKISDGPTGFYTASGRRRAHNNAISVVKFCWVIM